MIKTNASGPFASALKAKSPIVAIPVDGHAPICIKRSWLATWAKGVEILSVEVVQYPDEYYFEEIRVEGYYGNPHGPKDVHAVRVPGPKYLAVTGQVRSKGLLYASYPSKMIKTTAKFLPVPRQEAIKILSKWSENERLKIEKNLLLGALGKEQKKAMKRAKFEDEGEGMIPVMTAQNDTPPNCVTCANGYVGQNCKSLGHEIKPAQPKPKLSKNGLPVTIPELPKLEFALVKWGEDGDTSWTVTELGTGKAAGQGDSAELAVLDARQKLSKMTPQRRDEIQNMTLAASTELEVAA